MTAHRKRIQHTTTLSERLRQFADQAKAQAEHLPEGEARDQLIEKVRVTEKALQMEGWLSSPGLKPPT